MSDLVQRLRDRAFSGKAGDPLCAEAADEIASLLLTDAEWEAVAWAATHLDNCGWSSATLRGLLERMAQNKTDGCVE